MAAEVTVIRLELSREGSQHLGADERLNHGAPRLTDSPTGHEPLAHGPDPEQRLVVVNVLPVGEVARAALVLIAVGIGCYLLWRVQEVIFLMALAILLATAIEPLVNQLRRGPFTRGSGVLAVYTAIIIVIGVPAYAIAPSLASQSASFTETLPDRLQRLRPYAENVQPRVLQSFAIGALDNAIQAVSAPARPVAQEQVIEAGATAAHTLLAFFTVFVLAYYWLVERASIKRVMLRTVPARHARNVNTLWMEVEEKLGGWVRGQLILMLTIGAMATVGYALLGLPNPVLLGVAAGLFEIVPMIGPFLAFAPAVLVALAVIDAPRAIAVVVYALIIQQIESNILVPRIMGRTVGVSPLTVLLGILVGAALAGIPGAFLAVPIAAAAQVILAHALRSEDPSQAEEHRDPVDRAVHEGAADVDDRALSANRRYAAPRTGEESIPSLERSRREEATTRARSGAPDEATAAAERGAVHEATTLADRGDPGRRHGWRLPW